MKLLRLFGYDLVKASESNQISDVIDHPGWSDNVVQSAVLSTIISVSPWTATGIRKNQEKTEEIPFLLKKGKEKMELDSLPFLRKFPRLLESISFWLDLTGEAFIIVDRSNPVRPPETLELAPSICMELLTTEKWRYTPIHPSGHSMPVEYEPWQIIHIKKYGWRGQDWRGFSPMQALLETISTDKAILKYFKEWAESPAAFSGILSPQTAATGGLSLSQSKSVAGNVQKQLDNFTHTRRLLILTGPMQYVPSTKSGIENLNLPQFSEMTRTEILGALGVMEVMVGILKNVKSYEGIRAARTIYYQETIVPRCQRIGKAFQPLLDLVGHGDTMIVPDFSLIPELNSWMSRAESAAFAIERLGWTPKDADEHFDLDGPEDLPDDPLDRFVGFDDGESRPPSGSPGGANPDNE